VRRGARASREAGDMGVLPGLLLHRAEDVRGAALPSGAGEALPGQKGSHPRASQLAAPGGYGLEPCEASGQRLPQARGSSRRHPTALQKGTRAIQQGSRDGELAHTAMCDRQWHSSTTLPNL